MKNPQHPRPQVDNNAAAVRWLEAMLMASGHGAKIRASETLGLSQSGLSKILSRRSGFHEPTMRLMSWMLTSKAESYPGAEVLDTKEVSGIAIQKVRHKGQIIMVWKKPRT